MIYDLSVQAYELASFKVKVEENIKSAQNERIVELCTDIKEHQSNCVLKQSQILNVFYSPYETRLNLLTKNLEGTLQLISVDIL